MSNKACNCQSCNRPCLKPGEAWVQLANRIPDQWAGDFFDLHLECQDPELFDVACSTPVQQRFTLTGNLCGVCHASRSLVLGISQSLRYDQGGGVEQPGSSQGS